MTAQSEQDIPSGAGGASAKVHNLVPAIREAAKKNSPLSTGHQMPNLAEPLTRLTRDLRTSPA